MPLVTKQVAIYKPAVIKIVNVILTGKLLENSSFQSPEQRLYKTDMPKNPLTVLVLFPLSPHYARFAFCIRVEGILWESIL